MNLYLKISDSAGKTISHVEMGPHVSIPASMLADAGPVVSFSISVPIKDVAGYFNSSLQDGPVPRLDWTIEFDGSANRNEPILTFISQGGENRCTLYADNLIDDFQCKAVLNQETGCYDVNITFANRTPCRPFSMYLDTRGGDWTEAYARAMVNLRPQGIPSFPEKAFAPVYCTWYAVHACLTAGYLRRNAKRAADLGFGTFIVDDGWCIDEAKRVSPAVIDTWYDHIGDWKFSERKLPELKEDIAYARGLGLSCLFWVAPFFVFPESEAYGRLSDDERLTNRGACLFEPASLRTAREVLGKMKAVVRDFGLDGLKVDFLDSMPADPYHPRGREAYDFIARLSKAIRAEAGEDALIEFRQSYSTPQMLDFATQFRPNDVPYDYLRNISRIAALRILLGDHVPIQADPLFWRGDELDLTVARHMIASLAGVPMLSMDLSDLSERHEAIVRHYLGFYKEHQRILNHGHWRIRYFGAQPSFVSTTLGEERIVIVIDANALADATEGANGTVRVLNLSSESIDGKEAFAMNGERLRDGKIPCGGRGTL